MKKRLNFIIIASLLIVAGTSCNKADKEINLSSDSITATDSTEIITSTVATEPPTLATENATEDDQGAEIEIVEDIYKQFWGHTDLSYSDSSYYMDRMDELSNKYLGTITSENDAIEKGKTAIFELYPSAENYYSYEAEFNDEHNVWVVKGAFPPAKENPDGTMTATIGTRPIVVIRKSDGKVLGAFSG